MKQFTGKAVSMGIAIGKAYVFNGSGIRVEKRLVARPETEINRFLDAKKKAEEELQSLYEQALFKAGEAGAAIFEMYKVMLCDEEFISMVEHVIMEQGVNAEYAVSSVAEVFLNMFSQMDDSYMKERAIDVKDVTKRLLRILQGEEEKSLAIREKVILFADCLNPGEAVQINKEDVLAIVLKDGATNSHTVILAKMMGIPAIVGIDAELSQLLHGEEYLIDCFEGVVIEKPNEDAKQRAKNHEKAWLNQEQLRQKLKGKKTVTKGGREVSLYANVGSIEELNSVIENDGEGIGLFRSEFIYLGRTDYPTEDEQFEIYKGILEKMDGKPVMIRTLDVGGDKQESYMKIPREENPALGYRAVRMAISEPDIFKTQLRALLRAACYGNLSIMYPMITSEWEVLEIKRLVQEAEEELKAKGIAYRMVKQGVMIETPAAVMISEELADIVDFFSIGTNDLTQYTLAIDRQNGQLERFYHPYHKAVLRFIKIVIENAHKKGITVGICGELGSDLKVTEELIALGVDELSVIPSMILALREKIRSMP